MKILTKYDIQQSTTYKFEDSLFEDTYLVLYLSYHSSLEDICWYTNMCDTSICFDRHIITLADKTLDALLSMKIGAKISQNFHPRLCRI